WRMGASWGLAAGERSQCGLRACAHKRSQTKPNKPNRSQADWSQTRFLAFQWGLVGLDGLLVFVNEAKCLVARLCEEKILLRRFRIRRSTINYQRSKIQDPTSKIQGSFKLTNGKVPRRSKPRMKPVVWNFLDLE